MPLPIEPILPALRAALIAHRSAVLEAPPGAGKTTRVPLALYQEPWLGGQKIVMLEPRRLATRAAAARMASTLGERIGETVGYRMRLDTRVGPTTRIEVVTEGVLTRMLQHDLGLGGVGLVIFDEFHERSLIGDTGLALTLATADALREDLKILVMSATLDGIAVARLLGDAPIIRSEGRAWPVTTRHAPPRANTFGMHERQRLVNHVAAVVRDAIATESGSLLVFLPGAGEIRRVEEALGSTLPANVVVRPLHGSLPFEQQDAAIVPPPVGQRKVVLATSIAETSLTIDGVRVVIDSGEMRLPRFSARTGMTRLETVRVSRASADQRRGRAGRVEPGVCIRCWSLAEEAGLVPFTRPEILDADLAPLALDLARAGFADPGELRWLDPPPVAAFAQGRELLQLLGALDANGRITTHGTAMSEAGAHPRLAHMLVRAREAGQEAEAGAAAIITVLEDRDPMRGMGGPPPADITMRMDAGRARENQRPSGAVGARHAAPVHGAGTQIPDGAHGARGAGAQIPDGAHGTRGAGAQIPDGAHGARGAGAQIPDGASDPSIGLMLAWAYPDRVGQRRDAPGRFLLRNGRGATLPLTDPLAQAEWIVAAQIDDAGRDGRILLAAELDPAELLAHAAEQIETRDEISWNDSTRSVTARRRTMLGALVLTDSALPSPDAERVLAALVHGITRIGVGSLPWSAAAAALRERMAFVHHHDVTWPDVGDAALAATLDEWLAPRLDGVRKLDDVARVDLADALRGLLTWEQRRAIDVLAPERIEVPTGSRIAIDYSDPESPTLAVRLQELFGLTKTPVLVGGVPLTMQLLSPGYRPVQVTRDLASFWQSGYFDVRKDLRGRYPKHHWPDDPLAAAPVRGPKRRE
jgi:ATP-dependent RNA helicase HrpB